MPSFAPASSFGKPESGFEHVILKTIILEIEKCFYSSSAKKVLFSYLKFADSIFIVRAKYLSVFIINIVMSSGRVDR